MSVDKNLRTHLIDADMNTLPVEDICQCTTGCPRVTGYTVYKLNTS